MSMTMALNGLTRVRRSPFGRVLLAGLLASLGGLTSANAQDEAPAEQPTPRVVALQAIGDKEGGITVISGGDAVPFPMQLSFGGGGNFVIGGGPNAMMPQDDLGILGMEQFHDDLGLVPEQKERLSALRRNLQERRTKAFGDIRSLEPGKIGERVKETEKQLQEETKRQLSEILLPNQFERLKQMKVQLQMRNRGAAALVTGETAELLGLTDKQKADLAQKQREAEKQLREKIDEIRKQLVKDVIQDVLTVEQRAKLAELTGNELSGKAPEAGPVRVRSNP